MSRVQRSATKKKRDTKAADKPRIIENFYLLLSPEGRTINLCSVPFRFDQEIVQANKLKSRMMHCHGFFFKQLKRKLFRRYEGHSINLLN